MKKTLEHLEAFRHVTATGDAEMDQLLTKKGDRYGLFLFRTHLGGNYHLMTKVIFDDGEESGWEHASVSQTQVRAARKRELVRATLVMPTWETMCHFKSMFWEPDECVVQFHPAEENYVNIHPGCLHLWKPVGNAFPIPASILV